MYNDELRIKDRLEEILESIELIQEWSKGLTGDVKGRVTDFFRNNASSYVG